MVDGWCNRWTPNYRLSLSISEVIDYNTTIYVVDSVLCLMNSTNVIPYFLQDLTNTFIIFIQCSKGTGVGGILVYDWCS